MQFENGMAESDDKSREAIARLKKQGKQWNSTAPYGFRFERGEVVKEPSEQAVLRDLRRWRARGYSITRCTKLLAAKGHQPRGDRWHRTTVARLLKRVGTKN